MYQWVSKVEYIFQTICVQLTSIIHPEPEIYTNNFGICIYFHQL